MIYTPDVIQITDLSQRLNQPKMINKIVNCKQSNHMLVLLG